MSNLFAVDLADGRSKFIAHNRISGEPPIFGRFQVAGDEQGLNDLRGHFFKAFMEAVQDKKPEIERLKLNELYYAGFHWRDAVANRENKVTNFCFSTVETATSILTEERPRPEIVMRRQYGPTDPADSLQDFATWLMDVTGFDRARRQSTREKCKQGWCSTLVNVDPSTGLAYRVPVSNFDYYKDAFSESDDEMEGYFIARPVSTDWLQEQFPNATILPDGISSPSYDVYKRPYMDTIQFGSYASVESIVATVSRFEGEPNTGQTTSLVRLDGADYRRGANTTFLIQWFVRDRSTTRVHYTGDIATPNDAGGWDHAPSARPWAQNEPTCPSGWRVIQFCADGTFLGSEPLDPCFDGPNVVIGRAHEQLGRFYSPGMLDHIIPINRSINRRYKALNGSLEYEAVPTLVTDVGSGINFKERSVEPGDQVDIARGSKMQWLEFGGPSAGQFNLLTLEKMDLDTISGVHDAEKGRRPEGIEAAAALRELRDAAQTRLRGMEGPDFDESTLILKKMMVATGRKAKGPIWYRASNGQMKPMDPQTLLMEYDIRFAPGSGTAVGRQAQEEKVLALFDRGLMDTQSALTRLGIKGVDEVFQRLTAEKAMQAAAAAQASAAAGGPPQKNGNPSKGKEKQPA